MSSKKNEKHFTGKELMSHRLCFVETFFQLKVLFAQVISI